MAAVQGHTDIVELLQGLGVDADVDFDDEMGGGSGVDDDSGYDY